MHQAQSGGCPGLAGITEPPSRDSWTKGAWRRHTSSPGPSAWDDPDALASPADAAQGPGCPLAPGRSHDTSYSSDSCSFLAGGRSWVKGSPWSLQVAPRERDHSPPPPHLPGGPGGRSGSPCPSALRPGCPLTGSRDGTALLSGQRARAGLCGCRCGHSDSGWEPGDLPL